MDNNQLKKIIEELEKTNYNLKKINKTIIAINILLIICIAIKIIYG